jgi:hypothetical protein
VHARNLLGQDVWQPRSATAMPRALIQEGVMRYEEQARWAKLMVDFDSADLGQREFDQ